MRRNHQGLNDGEHEEGQPKDQCRHHSDVQDDAGLEVRERAACRETSRDADTSIPLMNADVLRRQFGSLRPVQLILRPLEPNRSVLNPSSGGIGHEASRDEERALLDDETDGVRVPHGAQLVPRGINDRST